MEYLGRNTERFKTVQVLNDLTVENVLFISNINDTFPTAGQVLTWDGISITWKDDTNTLYTTATSTVLGLIKLEDDATQTVAASSISTTAARTYGIQLNSSNQAVVNVPWTDTTYTLPLATTTVRGGVELGSDTDLTQTYETGGTGTSSRTYPVQLNSANQMGASVPWTDTNTTYSAGDGLDLSGTTFSTDLKSNGGLVIESTELAVDLGASSITGTLAVEDGGTGLTTVATDSLLTGNGTSPLTVEPNITVDGSATNGNIIAINAGALTTGSAIEVTDATFERASGHFSADITDTQVLTINRGNKGIFNVDYDRPAGSPVTNLNTVTSIGMNIRMDDNATNVGASTMIGLRVETDFASTGGITSGSGIYTRCGGGDVAWDLYMENFDDSDEFATLAVGAGGKLDLTTNSDDTTGHLTLDVDGDIYAKIPDQLEFSIVNTDGSGGTSHKFTSEVSAESHFYMYPSGGGITADYFHMEVGQDGSTVMQTVDGVGAVANLQITADGTAELAGTTVTLDASANIELNADGGSVNFKDASAQLALISSNGLDFTDNLNAGIIFEGGTDDAHKTRINVIDPTTTRNINFPNAAGTVALTTDTLGGQYWHQMVPGYRQNNTSTTNYYTFYRNWYENWSNSDSDPTSISSTDSYSSFFIAARAGQITNIKIQGTSNDVGYDDPFKFYMYKGALSNNSASMSLTLIATTSAITPPASANKTWSHTEDFTGASFSEDDNLYVWLKKDSNTGNQDLFFNININGIYTN